ncbi:MAG: hypothetical protein RLZZ347_729 [Candidatus Parcubacteria bacterium]|jgi:hypothetical protein
MKKSPDGEGYADGFEGLAQMGMVGLAQGIEEGLGKNAKKKKAKAEKKAEKAAKKKAEVDTDAQKDSTEDAEKKIAEFEEQIGANVDLLRALKDATEFIDQGGTFVESILTLLGEEVRIATEQGDLPAVDIHNQRRSAVGRLISLMGEIKDASVLEKITGEIIGELFDRATSGNLTLAEATVEIAKFTGTTEVEPESTPNPEPAPAPVSEPTKPSKKRDAPKPAPQGESKPSPEKVELDLSEPDNVAEFVKWLKNSDAEIEVPGGKGKTEVITLKRLAHAVQQHIRNLQVFKGAPEKQTREARAVLKSAPEDFGYRAGLTKLFEQLGFIESKSARAERLQKEIEALRTEVGATTTFADLCDLLSRHPEGVREGNEVFFAIDMIEALGKIEQEALRKDGKPVARNLMALLPVDCGVQAKASELFLQINPLKLVEEEREVEEPKDAQEPQPARKGRLVYSAQPGRSAIRVAPGMPNATIVAQQKGKRVDLPSGFMGKPFAGKATETGKVEKTDTKLTDTIPTAGSPVAEEAPARESASERTARLKRLEDAIEQAGADITAIISDERNADKMKEIREIIAPLRELLAKKRTVDTAASMVKKIEGYREVFLGLNAILKSLQMLLKKHMVEAGKEGGIVITDRVVEKLIDAVEAQTEQGGNGKTEKPIAPTPTSIPASGGGSPVNQKPQPKKETVRIAMPPKPVTDKPGTKPEAPKPIPAPLPRPPVAGTPKPEAKPAGKKETVKITLTDEQREKMDEANRKRKGDSKKVVPVVPPEVPPAPKPNTPEALGAELATLKDTFATEEGKLGALLGLYPNDPEIQGHKPKQTGAEVLLQLEGGKSLQKQILILQEWIATYQSALLAIETILNGRKQAQQPQAGSAGGTGGPGATPVASGGGLPPGTPVNPGALPNQPSGAPTVPKPSTVSALTQRARGWFKRNWGRLVGIGAIAGAAFVGGEKLGTMVGEQDIEKANARMKAVPPRPVEQRPAVTPERPRTPETAPLPRAPEQVATPRAPEVPAYVERYPGVNFGTELLKYPNALKSGWVFELFGTADQDLQRIRTPQDFNEFYKHYFGELNVGTQDFVKGRDIKENQEQRNKFVSTKKGSVFDLKVEYKWIGPDDVKLRLALVTKLREVLVATHFRFENTPEADSFIHYAQRLNNCAVLRTTLEGGITKLDPSFDYKTITDDGNLLDKLIEAQKQRGN